ncbi:MAG: helix-turn-helix transcriptional regulator [Clostridia bacterium]|nr:helix-turn-helix transcriptional regulator [Clostridia bacterium]
MYKRLKELREDNDLTQKKISEILNMSQTGYSQYEIGRNDIPTKILIDLAKHYNTTTDYILGLTDIKEPITNYEITKAKQTLINQILKLNDKNTFLAYIYCKGLFDTQD